MTAHENQSAAIYGCCFGLNIFTGLTQLVLMSQGAGRQVVNRFEIFETEMFH